MMMGGTELSYNHLSKCIHIPIPNTVEFHLSVAHEIDSSKYNIIWLHQAHDQPSIQNLRQVASKFEHLVFVSHWQREQYLRYLIPGFPLDRTSVIRNAVLIPDGVVRTNKSTTETRLIYSSTPFRGLDVLLDAFDMIHDDSLHLDVYSSMHVYGPSHAAQDINYETLYERCRRHPRITYHGSVDQKTLHQAFDRSHILAYPCTWEETSCITAMEAMTHGCLLVTSDIGALPETTAGLAVTYTPGSMHAEQYAAVLQRAVTDLRAGSHVSRLRVQRAYASETLSWHSRSLEWDTFFNKYRKKKSSIWRIRP